MPYAFVRDMDKWLTAVQDVSSELKKPEDSFSAGDWEKVVETYAQLGGRIHNGGQSGEWKRTKREVIA